MYPQQKQEMQWLQRCGFSLSAAGIACAFICTSAVAQTPSPKNQVELSTVLQKIQQSHVDANVPVAEDFNTFMQRDLRKYFSHTLHKENVSIHFELLRDVATQSGVAYPKYYAWVKVSDERKQPIAQGVVRLAAIEKLRFEVTDFIDAKTVLNDEAKLSNVIPKALCAAAKEKAAENR